jgi:hypothetical protein
VNKPGGNHVPRYALAKRKESTMKHSAILIVLVLVSIPTVAISTDWEEVFSDDFNRPDGPLGFPWFDAGPDTLYIQSGRVVSAESTYSLSGYDHPEGRPSAVLEAHFGFGGDEGGRFHFWIAGVLGPDTVAYGVEIEAETFGLYFYPPESLIVENTFAFDLDSFYTMRLAYDQSTGTASVSVQDFFSPAGDSTGATGVGTSFSTIRVGIENRMYADKWLDNVVFRQISLSGVPGETRAGSRGIELNPPYPNPCNGEAVIAYDMAVAGDVSVALYNALGQEVRCWHLTGAGRGYHETRWDGTSSDGGQVSSGVYVCTVETAEAAASRKIIVTR